MLKYFLFILLFNNSTCFDSSSELYKSIFKLHKERDNKAKFAHEVVHKIYNSFQQWYFTITYCNFTYFENAILKYLETYDVGYPILLLNGCPNNVTTKVKPRFNIHGQTTYLVTSATLSIDETDYIVNALQMTGVFQPRSTVIFVITLPVQLNNYLFHTMKTHFQLLWSRMVTNSVLILWSNRLRTYNYNPYLDVLKDITHIKDVNHFLRKQYDDLYGHELRLSVFRKVYVTDDTGPIVCSSRLAQTVMKSLNATCKPIVPRDGSTVGDLLANGTATGVTADLMDGYTDLELSSRILKTSYYGYIETTYPLTHDKLCFIVKNSEKQSAFITTLNLISSYILSAFILNFVLLIVIAILLRKFESKITGINDKQSTGSVMMDLIKCFLKQTIDIKYIGLGFRVLALAIITYSLIVNCALDGIITSAITYPRYKRNLNAMDLFMRTNLSLGVHNRDFKLFNDTLNNELYNLIKDRMEIFNDQKIKKFIDERQYQYATLLRKSDADYIVRRPKNFEITRPIFYVIPDCPVPCFIVYVLRYGSPYLTKLNYLLHQLYQAGILQHWMTTEEYSQYKNVFVNENKHRMPLNSQNMKEVFIVFLVGVMISTVVFIFEIIVHKIVN